MTYYIDSSLYCKLSVMLCTYTMLMCHYVQRYSIGLPYTTPFFNIFARFAILTI